MEIMRRMIFVIVEGSNSSVVLVVFLLKKPFDMLSVFSLASTSFPSLSTGAKIANLKFLGYQISTYSSLS